MVSKPACLFCLALLLAPAAVCAQWSSDPAVNMVIADRESGQTRPVMAAAADGGFFVAWLDAGGLYDVYLQRLAANGVSMWAKGGVSIVDRAANSTQEVAIAADATTGVWLAYQVLPSGMFWQLGLSRVTQDGEVATQTVLTDKAGQVFDIDVATTDDGNAVLTWIDAAGGTLRIRKIDPQGSTLWEQNLDAPLPWQKNGDCNLFAGNDGTVIAVWSVMDEGYLRGVQAQKFASADGASLWGSRYLDVFPLSQDYVVHVSAIPDGQGGTVVFIGKTGEVATEALVQHVSSNGELRFAIPGAPLGAHPSKGSLPIGFANTGTGDIYASWVASDGLRAQRIDSAGSRIWSDKGKLLVPWDSSIELSASAALQVGSDAMFSWMTRNTAGAMAVHAARLDAQGDHVWPGGPVLVRTGATRVRHLGGVASAMPFAAFVWEDGSDDHNVIKGQNVDAHGRLGVPGEGDRLFSDGFELPRHVWTSPHP